jgi:alcohol dehydrogenase (cytochrome c)
MRFFVFLVALAAAMGQDGTTRDGATHEDWPQHGGTNLFWRYSGLDQINTRNVKRLAPAWEFQTGDGENGLQATPIVSNGVLYLSTSRNNVYALDAANGRLMWQYRYPQPRLTVPYGPQNRGVAIGDGSVFMGTYDNYVVAIDQKTGVERWRVNVEDSKQCGCNITAAPLVVRDKVIVGGTGGDSAHRGYLSAFDTKTGRLKWRFYTIPGPGEKGHETWKGDSWKFGGGATWMTGSYDPALNLVYWGVGNAASDFYSGDRGTGDNLYTNSVIALDADSGKLRWHFQEVPRDVWDFDSAYESVLIDREVRGRMRHLLVHVNKGGFAFVLDRESGEFLNAYPIVDNYNWISGVTENGKLSGRKEPEAGKATYICPGAAGGKSWNQVAYSPRTGFLYTPSLEVCNDIVADRQDAKEGASFFGGNFIMKPPPAGLAHSHVDAYDPVTGKRQWSFSYKYSLLASILATAGDLVFTGDPEGDFFALDARSGEKLWSFQTGAGHRGSAVSYAVNGRQFIATPTGWGSLVGAALAPVWPEAETFRSGSTLIVFALPETAN